MGVYTMRCSLNLLVPVMILAAWRSPGPTIWARP